MQKLEITLQNCYGIKKLEHTFEFKQETKTYVIYAPNGCMKTSFAKTFRDISKEETTKDEVFPKRETKREILCDGDKIQKKDIFVIESYNAGYQSDKISTLVANKQLKQKYDDIHQGIDKTKEELFRILKKTSGLLKVNNDRIENNIVSDLQDESITNFFDIILDLKDKISKNETLTFSDINYNIVFNDKTVEFLNKEGIKESINAYVKKYHELTQNSPYLNNDFQYHNAENILKPLKDNKFFENQHSINLHDGKKNKIISTVEELNGFLEDEKNKIFKDKELQALFNELQKKISNNQLREFRNYLTEHQDILPELNNIKKFKKKLWIAYFTKHNFLFLNLVEKYEQGKKEIKAIIEDANREQTEWDDAVKIFNERFIDLPFSLYLANKEDSMLKEIAPVIEFDFKDGNDKKIYTNKEALLEILSQGEQRALYILNIIFEIEARKKNNNKTLFIVDDIADSFDYKNKYAILEYLKEISEINSFFMMILTHNFDFFRTVENRSISLCKNCLFTIKDSKGIKLEQFKGLRNPFKNDWIKDLDDNKKLIASIPFVRNLIEYTRGNKDEDYKKLTNLLHIKDETENITLKDINSIFQNTIQTDLKISADNSNTEVLTLIFKTAEDCLKEPEGINLEHKIVLSIAIRLKAELFMINQIKDKEFCNKIKKNQTYELLKKYKEVFPKKIDEIKLLDRVQLMTPIQIHINSFMYEPLIDMGYYELTGLYENIEKLYTNIKKSYKNIKELSCITDRLPLELGISEKEPDIT